MHYSQYLSGADLDTTNHVFNLIIEDQFKTIARLTTERDSLKADAARYRWLRSRRPGSAYRIEGVIYSEGGEGVDTAIDAIIAKEQTP